MDRKTIKSNIIAYMTKNPGSVPNYATLGGYDAAKPVFTEMRDAGEIVEGYKLSPTGKRMTTLYLKEFSHLSA